ncbi:MAG TPA: hypothetical protein VFR24_09510 [Candidatus Angelobacter sp.]|nr:hypothetical protein [Candidatus Angelobacter sp.]
MSASGTRSRNASIAIELSCHRLLQFRYSDSSSIKGVRGGSVRHERLGNYDAALAKAGLHAGRNIHDLRLLLAFSSLAMRREVISQI